MAKRPSAKQVENILENITGTDLPSKSFPSSRQTSQKKQSPDYTKEQREEPFGKIAINPKPNKSSSAEATNITIEVGGSKPANPDAYEIADEVVCAGSQNAEVIPLRKKK